MVLQFYHFANFLSIELLLVFLYFFCSIYIAFLKYISNTILAFKTILCFGLKMLSCLHTNV